jgi:geranylgeranyl pyrophosphate synthase
MNIEDIKSILLAIPEVASWPEMVEMVRAGKQSDGNIPCWEYPLLACRAVGGQDEQALPGMAATVCLLNGIHLVDDLLDEDPKGHHHRIGVGHAANIAVAFQAVAYRILEGTALSPRRLAAAQGALTRACLNTACGQNLDASPLLGDPEEAYWRVTASKTPPLFGSAFFLGALLGGSSVEVAQRIEALADPIGKVIQVGDDMTDALETPAKPDWNTRWNNLAILYAMEAEHEEQGKFMELIERVEEPEALQEAQEILVRSGAISYGTYQVIQNYQQGKSDLAALDLPYPDELGGLLESLVQPARDLFRKLGIKIPPELQEESSPAG